MNKGSNSGTFFATVDSLMNTQSKPKDLFTYLGLVGNDPDFVALSMGAPGKETFKGCSGVMLKSTQVALSDEEEERFTFQYGPCRGDYGFLEQLGNFLSDQYVDKVNSDDLMVTAGATQGLHLVATVMFDKNTPVFMEDPTYFIAVKVLREDLGMNIIPVPTDQDGINVEKLEELLKQYKPATTEGLKSPFWSMVYMVPTYNNPKGFCTSPDRCKALVRLARQYGVMLFAEDVYNMLNYTDKYAPPRLLTYDNRSDKDFEGHVLSNGTFSKIMGPGLRLGWVEAPPRILKALEKCAVAWSGGSFNHYTSKLMSVAIKNGFLSEHLANLRKEYGERMNLACQILEKTLPSSIKVDNPGGGFFLWLELPPSIDAYKLLKHAVDKYKVNFIFGASTSPTGGSKNCARLSISYCSKDKIEEGVQRFCNALNDMMTDTK